MSRIIENELKKIKFRFRMIERDRRAWVLMYSKMLTPEFKDDGV